MRVSYSLVSRFAYRFSSDLFINCRLLIEIALPFSLFSPSARAIDTEEKEFLGEINLMKSIGFHKNIINLIGASTHMKPLCVVLEYMFHGDLLRYLRKKKAHVSFYRILICCLGCFIKIFSYYFFLDYSIKSISKRQIIEHI